MAEFKIHFTPSVGEPVGVSGSRFQNIATNGAGLVVEVFARQGDSDPSFVFAHVLYVEKISEPGAGGELKLVWNDAEKRMRDAEKMF